MTSSQSASRTALQSPNLPKSSYSQPARAETKARYDQGPVALSDSASYITRNYATGTQYSQSIMNGNNAAGGSEFGGSVYSYNSTRDVGRYVREVHGRTFNAMNDTYLLPTDDNEWARLDRQHSALVVAMDGLYPVPEIVEAILAPVEGGEPKRILDIGCGTGSWAIEMASRFPEAEVMGVDLAPTPIDHSFFPPNLRFELDDINLGLTHFYDQYDFVHMRCVASGINDIEKTLGELQLCLKPGGFLLVIDGDIDLWKEDRSGAVPLAKIAGDEDVSGVSEHGSYLRRVIWEAHKACIMAGSCFDRTVKILDAGFYEYPMMDPETVAGGGVYIPIGTWAKGATDTETQMLLYAGTLTRLQFLDLHRAYHKILLQHGLDQATLDQWALNIDQELPSPNNKIWVRYRFCWGRRRAGPGLPAPSLPTIASNESSPSSSPPESSLLPTIMEDGPTEPPKKRRKTRYPGLHIYSSSDEAKSETKRRLDSLGVLPTPAVKRAFAAVHGGPPPPPVVTNANPNP